MAPRYVVVAILAATTMAVPWNPKTDSPMNGIYTYAKLGEEGVAVGLHRGTNYTEVISPSYFSTYAQVNWDAFTVDLDPEVVKELDGKLVNFVGYEFDLVTKAPNGTHVSVPAWELYNHHFGNTIMGKGVGMVKTHIPGDHHMDELGINGGGGPKAREHHHPGHKFVNTTSGGPLGQFASGGLIVGNGAESRKTFHFFAEGFGVLVDSPSKAGLHPMILDTKNREGTGTPQRPTGHGIVPSSSTVGPEEMYSGIHECPCSDKWGKLISSYSTLYKGTCKPLVSDAATCFAAASELGLTPITQNLTVNNPKLPGGCSSVATAGGYEINFNTNPKPTATCGAQEPGTIAPRVAGRTEDLVNVTLDLDPKSDKATITLQGPTNVWFGVGFGGHYVSTHGADPAVGVSMIGTNWTIVVFPNGTVQERKLGNHEPGVQLPKTVTVTSNTVANGLRTVVLTRSIAGVASDNFKFDPTANQVTFINAIGGSADFTYHVKKESHVVYMFELDFPTCICDVASDQGTIGGFSWGQNKCVGKPLGVMLDDPVWVVGPHANPVKGKGVNPTCDIHAYRGGLRCCRGGTIILDENQTVKNNTQFEWQLKYRYYYEVVEDASKVVNTFETSWWTEHNNNEHDVSLCLEKDKSKCQEKITSNFTAGQMCPHGCRFITMEGHCHIGCLGMEMWIMDDPTKPQLLCNATVKYGKGDGWMDELGYIAGAQTCIFGPGFQDPVNLHPDTKLMSVKISNNTNSYTGDMGLWEINAAPLPAGIQLNV